MVNRQTTWPSCSPKASGGIGRSLFRRDECHCAAGSACRKHLRQSKWVAADGQITSARDLGILARAIYRELPEYDYFWHLPGIKFGRRTMRNYNRLIDLYPGADGMKTGFICASGSTLSRPRHAATGAWLRSCSARRPQACATYKAAKLLEQGFGNNRLTWLMPKLGTVDQLVPIAAAPPTCAKTPAAKSANGLRRKMRKLKPVARTALRRWHFCCPIFSRTSSLRRARQRQSDAASGGTCLLAL